MRDDMTGRNIALYPWFKFCQGLIFWQAVWFLYFQNTLSAAEAILLYAVYDIATTVLEVPSGYMSDRLGRRFTLISSALAGLVAAALLATGDSFAIFAMGQIMLGASTAFASGTDSALLYESLAAAGREDEVEDQEVRAWRFSFTALAISAVIGGGLARVADALPFQASVAVFALVLMLTWQFRDAPTRPKGTGPTDAGGTIPGALHSLKAALLEPVLVWLFVLSLLLYIFSHIPFVFGQPFILEALEKTGFQGDAPLVSGVVSALMMVLSVATSLVALRLRKRVGLPAILLLAFGLQIGLTGVLALTNDAIAIAFLFLRMVPDSLSKPFILARIQPLLSDDSRATYLSLQSFSGRLIFAGSLYVASLWTSGDGAMAYAEIQQVLGWYFVIGLVCLAGLAAATRRVRVDHHPPVE